MKHRLWINIWQKKWKFKKEKRDLLEKSSIWDVFKEITEVVGAYIKIGRYFLTCHDSDEVMSRKLKDSSRHIWG